MVSGQSLRGIRVSFVLKSKMDFVFSWREPNFSDSVRPAYFTEIVAHPLNNAHSLSVRSSDRIWKSKSPWDWDALAPSAASSFHRCSSSRETRTQVQVVISK
jgi:hypothetical protein